ncbi:copper(2+) exporting ATPase [Ceratobasidium sp. AG-Ba]|nr:copper(2+) exporting ATPase [Ceratobasidium sp. AG-Ba]
MPTLIVPQIHCGSCKTFLQSLISPVPASETCASTSTAESCPFLRTALTLRMKKLIGNVEYLLSQAGYMVAGGKRGRPALIHLPRRRATPSAPLTLNTEVAIEGMTCASITNALQELPGIISVDVKLMLNSASIIHDGNVVSASDIANEIESIGFGASVTTSIPVQSEAPLSRETVFGVVGMTCSSCSGPLNKAVSALNGVERTTVSLVSNSMTVRYNPDQITLEEIVETIQDCGFEVSESITRDLAGASGPNPSERVVQIELQQMYCGECPTRVVAHLLEMGVEVVSRPTLASPIATIRYVPNSKLNIRAILASLPSPIRATIYHPPSIHSISMRLQAREARKIAWLFTIATLFAIPTFVVGIVGMVALPKVHPFRRHVEQPVWGGAALGVIVLWALATPVQFGVGWIFYKKSYASLFGGRRREWRWTNLFQFGNMDLLVALSTTTAYMASVAMMAIDVRTPPHHQMGKEMRTYFDSSVFLIFFILAGRLLEGRARVKTGDAISMLGAIRPERALLVTAGESNHSEQSVTQVSVDELELGDTILVQPGSVPPADGVIISGQTTVDESSLTGESLPVTKGPGDGLVCGTTNLTGAVTVRIESLGDATVLEKIVLVACPCGIGLAAPTAQAVGAGMAAKAGVLAQGGGEAFQLASQVTTVVFDKTGTLTVGEPAVTDSVTLEAPNWVPSAVREMEVGSSHPIALAIVRHCESSEDAAPKIQLLECEEKSGRGLVGLVQVEGETYPILVGNALLLREYGAVVDDSLSGEWQAQGKTVVFVAIGPSRGVDSSVPYRLVMRLAVADALRPEAPATVSALHDAGKEVWMLSGDNIVTAKAVAKSLAIPEDRVVAGVLPHEKAAFISRLQGQPIIRTRRFPWASKKKGYGCILW